MDKLYVKGNFKFAQTRSLVSLKLLTANNLYKVACLDLHGICTERLVYGNLRKYVAINEQKFAQSKQFSLNETTDARY